MIKVHILTIDDNCGTTSTAHRTDELATAALWRYVSGRWSDVFDGAGAPMLEADGNPWPHIERFFDEAVQDSFTIQSCEIEDEGPPRFDAISFDRESCQHEGFGHLTDEQKDLLASRAAKIVAGMDTVLECCGIAFDGAARALGFHRLDDDND